MSQQIIILDEDKQWARDRITSLEEEILALGPEFYDVFNQSSETWHDNAPFDALRDRQSVLDAEKQQLKGILRTSLPNVPRQWPDQIGIGSRVFLADAKEEVRYTIAGDWTPFAGQLKNGSMVISAKAPLALELLGKKVGDEIIIRQKPHTITKIIPYRSASQIKGGDPA